MRAYYQIAMTMLLLLTIRTQVATGADVIQCGNLIYAGTQTSRCFSDEFLGEVQKKTTIQTERRFKSVKLDSEELFKFPFIVITGESNFYFSPKEREHFKKYLENGGFVLASAGCSSKNFDESFRREMKTIFKDPIQKIPAEHPVFSILNKIDKLKLRHDEPPPPCLEGLKLNDKMVLIYSAHGLNDTAHTSGCCCCGGNEIQNSIEVNVNILLYALMH